MGKRRRRFIQATEERAGEPVTRRVNQLGEPFAVGVRIDENSIYKIAYLYAQGTRVA